MPASLEGLRIAHLTDLHIERPRQRHQRIIKELALCRPDLIFFTGDYMSYSGDEQVAMTQMEQITRGLRPPHGIYGVFGNHDTLEFRTMAKNLPVKWLVNESHVMPELGIELLGLDMDRGHLTDVTRLVCDWHAKSATSSSERPLLRLMLAHMHTFLPAAGDLGVDIMFCGHTHGGQCRLPGGFALRNSSDLPLSLTSGIFRHQNTLAAVSRGLGEVNLPFRLFCPPHLPVYTLRRGIGLGEHTYEVRRLRKW
ncbi:MAG: metallophosphoesterase family protein [Phycisphaeraceae bacterium]|nr:metallophosphoesterase family protein [Phycisphaeraceae bacterium]